MFINLQPYLVQYGEPVLFASVFLEAAGLPFPGETAIVAAFVMAAVGKFNFLTIGLIAWAAAVLGDNLGYAAGRFIGREVLLRYGGAIGISAPKLERAERALGNYGPVMVAGARFFPILRQIAGLSAGIIRMPWPHFLLANMSGALLWVGMWGSLAVLFGSRLQELIAQKTPFSSYLFILLPAIIIPFAIIYLVHRMIERGNG